MYEELLRECDPEAAAAPQRVKTPVAAAAELGDLDLLRQLLAERPLGAAEPDDLGVTPLMSAQAHTLENTRET